jgi:hypothetical protein
VVWTSALQSLGKRILQKTENPIIVLGTDALLGRVVLVESQHRNLRTYNENGRTRVKLADSSLVVPTGEAGRGPGIDLWD